ncbi:MAG: hypothetical protein QM811_29285 [Pirellulales bacterium]
MMKLIAFLAVALCGLSYCLHMQTQSTEGKTPKTPEKKLIRVDNKYTGDFDELVGQEVEVIGVISIDDKDFLGEGRFAELISTGRGGFEITNWGPLWAKKKVRIVGKVSIGIDDRKKYSFPNGEVPSMVITTIYRITIRSIELLEDGEKPR